MKFSNAHINDLAKTRAFEISVDQQAEEYRVYGVPRGGIPAAYILQAHLRNCTVVDDPDDATIIFDDLIDSGGTKKKWERRYPDVPFYALYTKAPDDGWIEFPWETSHDGQDTSGHDIAIRLLQFIGEDPTRGGLLDTPKRMMKAWRTWTAGYDQDPAAIMKVFEDGAEKCDEMVVVRDIPFYSHCEHHLAPIFGVAHIGYIPDGKIVGLSKLSRLTDVFARRLQVQERLTNQIADALQDNLNPVGVGVVIEARHLCMESRGICKQGHKTVTSALRGDMRDDPSTRNEFLNLVRS